MTVQLDRVFDVRPLNSTREDLYEQVTCHRPDQAIARWLKLHMIPNRSSKILELTEVGNEDDTFRVYSLYREDSHIETAAYGRFKRPSKDDILAKAINTTTELDRAELRRVRTHGLE